MSLPAALGAGAACWAIGLITGIWIRGMMAAAARRRPPMAAPPRPPMPSNHGKGMCPIMPTRPCFGICDLTRTCLRFDRKVSP